MMIPKDKTKLFKLATIAISIIIILLGGFYLYNYISNGNGNGNGISNSNMKEGFEFTSLYTGEPSPTGTNYVPTQNSKYALSEIQCITANNFGLYALDKKMDVYYYSTATNSWVESYINLNNPIIRDPNYDSSGIICRKSDNILLNASATTLWFYSGGLNGMLKSDCLYYMTLPNDGTISNDSNSPDNLYCLALPLITVRIPPTTTLAPNATAPVSIIDPNAKYPLQPYDYIRLIASNKIVIFALGCYKAQPVNGTPPPTSDIGLYYCLLNNGIPVSNNAENWQYIGLPSGILRDNISHLVVNDSYVFIHTSVINPNGSISYAVYYMPITVKTSNQSYYLSNDINWIQMGSGMTVNILNAISFQSLTVNNDVIWGVQQNNSTNQTVIWWYALYNKTEAPVNNNTYKWKSIGLTRTQGGNTSNVMFTSLDCVLYNNNLIIIGPDSGNGPVDYTIPLLGNYTPSPTGIVGIGGADTPTNTAAAGSGGSGGGSPTISGGGSVPTISGGGSVPTISGAGSGAGGNPSTTKIGGAGGSGSGGGSGGGGSTTATGANGLPLSLLGGLTGSLSLQADGNKNNLNDFLAKNTLIGSNLYVSPMNNPSTYVPPQTQQASRNRNISSSFNPSVEFV